MVTHLAHTIAKECAADLKLLGQDPARLLKVQPPFERIDYADAIKELQRQGFQIAFGDDLGAPHEKGLTEGRASPIFVCDWPASIKAFYMAEKPGTDRVLCSDLLAPDGYGEIIGGSQRSEDVRSMKRRLLAQWHAMGTSAEHDDRKQFQHERHAIAERLGKGATDEAIDAEYLRPYEWYFDLRRYGSVPHSGFGLGVERLLRWFTGQEHIRDMLPYPRTPSRAYP
jgi:asparaginyl-tRNA synthetase